MNQTDDNKAAEGGSSPLICSGWRKALPDKAGWWWWRNDNGHSDMVECQVASDGSIQRIEHDYYDFAYTEESSWWFGPVAMPEFNVPNA